MISILIPYYKIIFFRETLLSLSNQTHQGFQVYIFDDNSSESPKELLEEFKNKFSFTYHKFENNLGGISLVKHWERCLNLVNNSEWLMILGDDDVLDPNVVANFYRKKDEIDSLDINVLRFSTEMINEKGIVTSQVYTFPEVEPAIESLMNKLMGLTRSSLSEYVFRRAKFADYSFKEFPSALFTDDILILEHSSFKNIFTINSSIIQIRKSSINLSGGAKISNRYKAILDFYRTLLLDFNSKFNKEQIQYIENKIEREIFNHKKIEVIVFMMKYYFKHYKFWKLIKLLFTIVSKFPKLIYLKLSNRT